MTDGSSDSEPPPWRGSTNRESTPAAFDLADPDALLTSSQRQAIEELIRRAILHMAIAGEVRARVVADPQMAEAHLRYSGVPGTTDVLTFDLSDPGSAAAGRVDTDIYICADEARRQAASRGHGIDIELALYTIHGILHCLGFDDHDDESFAIMHQKEDQILTAIGVGPVFARQSASGGGPN